jgi:hypothetical protein
MIFLFSKSISAQNEKEKAKKDTTEKAPVDSSIIKHSPRKATIFSAVIPGLGQVYNKKYWKVPIIYGGFATLAYFIVTNNNYYVTNKNDYRVINDSTSTNSLLYQSTVNRLTLQYPGATLPQISAAVLSARDYYRRNRDLCYILSGILYIMNVVDADVDAHLFYFDVSDKLTLNWKPTFYQATNFKNYPGLSLKLNF